MIDRLHPIEELVNAAASESLPAPRYEIPTPSSSRRKLTPNAVVRDTSKMGARLRRRRLKLGADIELSASPEALVDKVTIEQIEGRCAGE